MSSSALADATQPVASAAGYSAGATVADAGRQFVVSGLIETIIATYDGYVHVRDGTYVADIPGDLYASAPGETAAVLAAIAEANVRLTVGDTIPTLVDGSTVAVSAASPSTILPPRGGGENPAGGTTSHWWGYTVWMNLALTNIVIKDLRNGSNAAGLLAALGFPNQALYAIIAALGHIGASYLEDCMGYDGVNLNVYFGLAPHCSARN